MTELLPRAFAALGSAPTALELALVANTPRNAKDREAVRALEAAVGDIEAFRALARLAVAAGSSGFVALDLVCALSDERTRPG